MKMSIVSNRTWQLVVIKNRTVRQILITVDYVYLDNRHLLRYLVFVAKINVFEHPGLGTWNIDSLAKRHLCANILAY